MPNLASVYQAGDGAAVERVPGGLVARVGGRAAVGGEGEGCGGTGAEEIPSVHTGKDSRARFRPEGLAQNHQRGGAEPRSAARID